MRILALDYGRARIGLALSDPKGIIASPIGKTSAKDLDKAIAELAEKVRVEKVELIMCGLPLFPSGKMSDIANEAMVFGNRLSQTTNIPVDFYNETYSTVMAEEHIKQNLGIKNPKKIGEMVDTMAAAMLLQEYLDTKRYASLSERSRPV